MDFDIAQAISDYGFPVIAAMGMGYFIFFIWKWVTEVIDPVLGETNMTLIKLVDRVRMLDNDLIRLNMKLSMVLEYRSLLDEANIPQKDREELDDIINKYQSKSAVFNSTGKQDAKKPEPPKEEPKPEEPKKK
jgi:hypothetical protein